MIFQQGVDVLSQQKVLDPISSVIQRAIIATYRAFDPASRRVANALYGTWLGHPYHPAATDIPVGAWTACAALDALAAFTGSDVLDSCADAALAFGTLGAVPAVLSGLTDAQHPKGRSLRVAMTHGILNVSATLLQAVSLTQRARGNRGAARFLSAVVYGGVLVSAYLGGELIEKYRIGVNRAAQEAVPFDFVPVMAEADLPENALRQVDVSGSPVLLVRQGGTIYAMHATCTHMSGPLAQGRLIDGTVQCPLHGSRFALDDGHVVGGPATFPERCLSTRIMNGQIEVGPSPRLGTCEHAQVFVRTGEARGEAVPAMALP